jgi:glycosyltransferase involved in cell wall biosynthesis
MKIIFVGNTSWSMIKFRYGLIKYLLLNEYEVYIIAPEDDPSTNMLKKLGVNYIPIEIENKGSNPLKDIILLFNLKSIYKKIKPDLIIHFTIKPNIYGTIASKLLGIPSIAVVTGLGYTFIHNNIIGHIAKILYKLSFLFAEKVVFLNQDDKTEFLHRKLVNNSKILQFPGEGIDLEYFKPMQKNSNKAFKFLLVARMLWDKGIGEYIEAAHILSSRYDTVEFGLLGYLDVSNPKAINKKQMEIWTKEKYIKFYGAVDDVRLFVNNSDAVVLPSYREGLSMTLMEAAALQKPIITTNVPGCKDLVVDGDNGFLCKAKDASDLAHSMEKLILLPENERDQMGINGRLKMIRQFDQKIIIDKYINEIINQYN